MRSNLEQITWKLLPLVWTQNVKQFRKNFLAAAATGIDTKCAAIKTNYLVTAPTILALNVKQFRMNYLPLLLQYWRTNVKQFRANYLVAAINIDTKLWINLEQKTWQLLTPILAQIVKQFITNNLATAPTILALNMWSTLEWITCRCYHNIDTKMWSNLEQITWWLLPTILKQNCEAKL